jgi:hypothetical protein
MPSQWQLLGYSISVLPISCGLIAILHSITSANHLPIRSPNKQFTCKTVSERGSSPCSTTASTKKSRNNTRYKPYTTTPRKWINYNSASPVLDSCFTPVEADMLVRTKGDSYSEGRGGSSTPTSTPLSSKQESTGGNAGFTQGYTCTTMIDTLDRTLERRLNEVWEAYVYQLLYSVQAIGE